MTYTFHVAPPTAGGVAAMWDYSAVSLYFIFSS